MSDYVAIQAPIPYPMAWPIAKQNFLQSERACVLVLSY